MGETEEGHGAIQKVSSVADTKIPSNRRSASGENKEDGQKLLLPPEAARVLENKRAKLQSYVYLLLRVLSSRDNKRAWKLIKCFQVLQKKLTSFFSVP